MTMVSCISPRDMTVNIIMLPPAKPNKGKAYALQSWRIPNKGSMSLVRGKTGRRLVEMWSSWGVAGRIGEEGRGIR